MRLQLGSRTSFPWAMVGLDSTKCELRRRRRTKQPWNVCNGFVWYLQVAIGFLLLLSPSLLLLCLVSLPCGVPVGVAASSSSSSSSSTQPLVLRIRQLDGSIQRIQFEEGPSLLSSLTLEQVLEQSRSQLLDLSATSGDDDDREKNHPDGVSCSLQFGKYCIPLSSSSQHVSRQSEEDDNNVKQKPLKELGIRHGSLLTMVSTNPATTTGSSGGGLQQKKKKKNTDSSSATVDRWDPYPHLAKNYERARRHVERRKRQLGKVSFADLSELHRSLHVVEAQPTAPLHRLYLCPTVAERFAKTVQQPTKSTSSSSSSSTSIPRVALLFGTIHKERRNQKKLRAAKTSLSSTTESEEYCQVAKVQAIWEPPQSKQSSYYDASELLQFRQQAKYTKMLNVAKWLGLVPVGWLYSYPDDRVGVEGGGGGANGKSKRRKNKNEATSSEDESSSDEAALPVFGVDVETGARLQMECMKQYGREEGQKFVTVAMHGPTGATEAFQLSDVAVQMVAEDMLVLDDDKGDPSPQRFVSTRHAILVDGRETTTLDSVLCLVNTALLQQPGSFVGERQGSSNGVKSNNPLQLTKKMRKTLSQAAAAAAAANDDTSSSSSSSNLMELLCNFQVLVALAEDLPPSDMQRLVETVRKFTRGYKKGTCLESDVLDRLRTVLDR